MSFATKHDKENEDEHVVFANKKLIKKMHLRIKLTMQTVIIKKKIYLIYFSIKMSLKKSTTLLMAD